MAAMWTSGTLRTTVGDKSGQQAEAQSLASGISALWEAKAFTVDSAIIFGVDVAAAADQMGVMLDITTTTSITTKTVITLKTDVSSAVASQMARSMSTCGPSIAGSCIVLTKHQSRLLGWTGEHSMKVRVNLECC